MLPAIFSHRVEERLVRVASQPPLVLQELAKEITDFLHGTASPTEAKSPASTSSTRVSIVL